MCALFVTGLDCSFVSWAVVIDSSPGSPRERVPSASIFVALWTNSQYYLCFSSLVSQSSLVVSETTSRLDHCLAVAQGHPYQSMFSISNAVSAVLALLMAGRGAGGRSSAFLTPTTTNVVGFRSSTPLHSCFSLLAGVLGKN